MGCSMNFTAFDFSALGLYHERLCLDFANTAGEHDDPSRDHLLTYADLLAWSDEVGLLTADEADYLYAQSLARPGEAAAVFNRASSLREAIYAILSDVAHGLTPRADALDRLNAALTEAMGHLRLAADEAHAHWDWVYPVDDLAQMLGPVAWSTAEVLQSDDRHTLRECEGHDCDWLFLDTSRNHSRRWCSMDSCGNRAKARRHHARARNSPKPAGLE